MIQPTPTWAPCSWATGPRIPVPRLARTVSAILFPGSPTLCRARTHGARGGESQVAAANTILLNLREGGRGSMRTCTVVFNPAWTRRTGLPTTAASSCFSCGRAPGQSIDHLLGRLPQCSVMAQSGRSIRPAAPSSTPTCIRGYKRPSRSIIVVLLCIALLSNQAIPASSFHIGRQGAEHPRNSTIERARTCRPLDEILRDLGEILPKRAAATATDQIPFVEMRNPELAKCCVRARLFFRIEKVKQPPLRLFGAPSDGIVQTGSKTHLLAAETASHLRGH
jgi:hypothetical protein